MGTLKDRIAADLTAAMKARDQVRLDTLRSAISGFTYKRSEAGRDLSDADELAVVVRLVKQRGDSLAEFERAGRSELAEKERLERAILSEYLPQQKSEDEVRAEVRAAIGELPEASRTHGAAMKAAMSRLKGVADGNLVRRVVEEELRA